MATNNGKEIKVNSKKATEVHIFVVEGNPKQLDKTPRLQYTLIKRKWDEKFYFVQCN
jgi:hypothetical protein